MINCNVDDFLESDLSILTDVGNNCHSCKTFQCVTGNSHSSQQQYLKLLIHTFHEYDTLLKQLYSEKIALLENKLEINTVDKRDQDIKEKKDYGMNVVVAGTFTVCALSTILIYLFKRR
jgi:hypothetical protein